MSLLARLIEAGTPADLVAEVAMELAMASARAEVAKEAIESRRANESARTRHYRQRGGGQVSPQLRQEILERDGFACLECGTDERLEIDHIIPLAKGGDPVHPDNLQTLCRPCNARKRDRIRNADNRGKLRTIAESEEVQNTPSLSRPPNENNSNPPTHTLPDMNTRPRKADDFPRPEWADPQVWADWMKVRTAKKASNTATAYRGFLRSIADQQTAEWPPGRLLAHAVENSWKSIHRPQESRNDRPHHDLRPSHANGSDKRSSLARAIDEGLEFLGSP